MVVSIGGMASRNYQIRGLTDQDIQELHELAERDGRSVANLIRHVLRLYLSKARASRGAEAQQSA